MPSHLSLLRGINVAGHRKLKMAELTALYRQLGYTEVTHYLQSGNILFSAQGSAEDLATRIRTAILNAFAVEVSVRVFPKAEWLHLTTANPLIGEAGIDPQSLHLTVLFDPPKTEHPGDRMPLSGAEKAVYANGHYYIFCPHGYGRTKINNGYFERALKIQATTRNWKTVVALKERLVS